MPLRRRSSAPGTMAPSPAMRLPFSRPAPPPVPSPTPSASASPAPTRHRVDRSGQEASDGGAQRGARPPRDAKPASAAASNGALVASRLMRIGRPVPAGLEPFPVSSTSSLLARRARSLLPLGSPAHGLPEGVAQLALEELAAILALARQFAADLGPRPSAARLPRPPAR